MIKIATALTIAIAVVVGTLPAFSGGAATQAADNVSQTSQSILIKKRMLILPLPTITINQ
jgi:hypothetical protein